MSDQSYSTAFTVDRTPVEVFAAINRVRDWWTGDIDGITDQLGEEFSYRYQDLHYSKQKVVELVPGARVVWHVVEARLPFARDPQEWTGTDIVFDIAALGDATQVRFTHLGLVPDVECYEACSGAWGHYLNGSLRQLISGAAA